MSYLILKTGVMPKKKKNKSGEAAGSLPSNLRSQVVLVEF